MTPRNVKCHIETLTEILGILTYSVFPGRERRKKNKSLESSLIFSRPIFAVSPGCKYKRLALIVSIEYPSSSYKITK